MKGLEGMSCEDSLRTLTFPVWKKETGGKLLALYSFPKQGSEEGGDDLFSLGCSDRMYHRGIAQTGDV